MRHNNKIVLLQSVSLALLALLLTSCNPANTQSPTANVPTFEDKQSVDEKKLKDSHRVQQFVTNFSDTHPDFELLDYVYGDNNSVLLVVIAKNLKNSTSSTLFIMDENGVGQIVLASDYNATYRREDGLKLEGNVVLLSLDLQPDLSNVRGTDNVNEIHDFEITVTKKDENGSVRTTYSSKETIRPN